MRRITQQLPPEFAGWLLAAGCWLLAVQDAGASEAQLQRIAAEGLQDVYFRDGGELRAMRPEQLLDTEDRAVLRTLLRISRKRQTAPRVYVLFHRGQLHSVHATVEAAEGAAEAEGAPAGGWTSYTPGAALPSAAEVVWRVQPLPLGGVA
ncbi:hypothetical protein ACFYN3_40745 [Streptomyces lavendulae]|uniref:hypothetical protein n=1 Tax=Streptomyces lavendulae TaxID=1914 RepID=UPI0036778A07